MIIDCHNHVGADVMFHLRGEFPYAQQLANLVHEGRAEGVDRWIVFPFVFNLSFDLSAMLRGELVYGGLERVPYALENRSLMREVYELFPEEGKHCLPFAMLDPMREPEAQAEELRKLRSEYPFHGLKLQTSIIQSDIKCLAGRGRCFIDLAAEWDIPFLIHSSVLAEDRWALAKDILDIAGEFPRVRFCLAHSCRYDREYLDRVAALPNTWFDCSAHCIHCDAAAGDMTIIAPRGRRFESDYTNPACVLGDLAAAYPTKLLWGSDSPYYSYAGKFLGQRLALWSTYERETAALKAQPPAVVDRIANRNIRDWLKLKDESVFTG